MTTRAVHTHEMQLKVHPGVRKDVPDQEFYDWLKESAVHDLKRTNPDAEVVSQEVRRIDNDANRFETFIRGPEPDGYQEWVVKTRFSTALPGPLPRRGGV